MKVLVLGSGGREHALAWRLAACPSVTQVASAPGNPGTAAVGPAYPVAADDVEGVVALQLKEQFDLVVIGPEDPLALGLADRLRAVGAAVLGPGADGARLEASKSFAKDFMARHGIPTAGYRTVTSLEDGLRVLAERGVPVVVKASGLAAGKGVTVATDMAAAQAALRDCFEGELFGDAGRTVVLEDMLEGEEASLFVLTDGERYALLPGAQDHKRAFEGDTGPNTGGMGAYSPAPILDAAMQDTVVRAIVEPTLAGLRAEGIDYRGLLYVGLMIGPSGPAVVEYNVRFGDPETQVVLPRIEGDLGSWLLGAARGRMEAPAVLPCGNGAALGVVLATADYPRSSAKGLPISGIPAAEEQGCLVFHAGVARSDQGLITAGGRVLAVVATGATLEEARDRVTTSIKCIQFEGMRWRTDIGHRALARAARMKETQR